MRIQLVGLLVTCFFLSNSSLVLSQNIEIRPDTIEAPKVGIRISRAEFDSLVRKFAHLIRKKDSITDIHDWITLARLFNTVYYSELNREDPYKELINLYVGFGYSKTMIKKLEAIPQKGLWFYSPKYDIGLGGPPTKKSQFMLVGK